jgi:hypothetical protein
MRTSTSGQWDGVGIYKMLTVGRHSSTQYPLVLPMVDRVAGTGIML